MTKTEKYRIEKSRNVSTDLDVPLSQLDGTVYDSIREARDALPEGLQEGEWVNNGQTYKLWLYPAEMTDEEIEADIEGYKAVAFIVEFTVED